MLKIDNEKNVNWLFICLIVFLIVFAFIELSVLVQIHAVFVPNEFILFNSSRNGESESHEIELYEYNGRPSVTEGRAVC